MALPVSFPCNPCCPVASTGFCGPCVQGLSALHLTLSGSTCPCLVMGFPYELAWRPDIALFLAEAGAWYYQEPTPCGGPGFPIVPPFYILAICHLSLQPGAPSTLSVTIHWNYYADGIYRPCDIVAGIPNVFAVGPPCPSPFVYNLGTFVPTTGTGVCPNCTGGAGGCACSGPYPSGILTQ